MTEFILKKLKVLKLFLRKSNALRRKKGLNAMKNTNRGKQWIIRIF